MKQGVTKSIVIVDTESYALGRVALHNTLERFPTDEVLIFTDAPEAWGAFSTIKIPPIASIAEYNALMLTVLPERLTTDFALIIQFDGFAINAQSFEDLFFDFDYIGAPWPDRLFPHLGSTVGNGGFSLRSNRLIESVARHAPTVDFDTAEDVTICVELRERLERQHGVKFAPLDVAGRFSVELDRSKSKAPFGFHGMHILPAVYGQNYPFLIDNLPRRCFQVGSSQLDHLRFGFRGMDAQAKALLEAQVHGV